jgi:hypothetical protein
MSNICESCGCNSIAGNWLLEEEDYSDEVEDVINEPSHYARWSIEPITYIMRNGMEFWRGNLIKYSSRAGFKIYDGKTQEESEITDLEKVKRYCDMRINQIKGEVEL